MENSMVLRCRNPSRNKPSRFAENRLNKYGLNIDTVQKALREALLALVPDKNAQNYFIKKLEKAIKEKKQKTTFSFFESRQRKHYVFGTKNIRKKRH